MVFVDSNVWIAYHNTEDKFHERAKRALAKIKATDVIYVSSGIVHEVINYLFRIKGKKQSETTLEFFLTAPNLEIVMLNENIWIRSIELFKKYELSLTDAQIIAAMEEKGEKIVYSFDRHFDLAKEIERRS